MTASTTRTPQEPGNLNSAMNDKTTYERLRALIVWLGLTELAWIAYWLLTAGSGSPGFVWTVVFWIAVMLAWMGGVMYLAARGFFLKHTRYLSNVVGVAIVVTFVSLMFAIVPAARSRPTNKKNSASKLLAEPE